MGKATVAAIILAAGESSRMRGVDKLTQPLLGRPLLSHCLDALGAAPGVERVIVVASERGLEAARAIALRSGAASKVAAVRVGGRRRQDSVRAGLAHIGGASRVLVHDGARPLLAAALIGRAIAASMRHEAAIAAVPVKDTIKRTGEDMIVRETPNRGELWAAQTPQIFHAKLLIEAHRSICRDVTDDAEMVEAMGREVSVFMGDYANIKVTTPEDLVVAEALLRARSAAEAP